MLDRPDRDERIASNATIEVIAANRRATWFGSTRRAWIVLAILLFAGTAAKGMVWVSLMPLGQHPDEPAHAAVSDHLSRTWSFRPGSRTPSLALDTAIDTASFHRMVFRPWSIGAMDDDSLAARERRMKGTAGDQRHAKGSTDAVADGYPPLYYAFNAPIVAATAESRYDTTWMLERSLSVLMSSITIVVQLVVFAYLFASLPRAGLAALSLSLLPMYTAMESAINPEVLLSLLGSLSILLALRILRKPASIRLHLLSGLVLAALLLTKPNGAVLVVPYLTASFTGLRSLRRSGNNFGLLRILRCGLAFAAPIMVFYGGWRALPARRSSDVGADPLALLPNPKWDVETLASYGNFVMREGRFRFSDSFWGVFGWVDAPLPSPLLAGGLVILVVSVTVIVVRVLDTGTPWWFWTFVSAIAAVLVMLVWVEYGIVATTGQGMIQGRYFFSVIVALVGLQMWALDQFARTRPRVRRAMWIAAPIAIALVHIVAVLGTVGPRYYL